LNQDQFTHALFQGIGRPHLWLQAHDASPYTDVLLQACLHNPVYDRQCEGSRASYLHELIQLTPAPLWFRQQILDALANPTEAMDRDQLFDFALFYARAGDTAARDMLYEHAAVSATRDDSAGAYQLIDLDGVDGFLFLANRLGEAMRLDPTFWDDDHLLRHLEATVGVTDVAELRHTAHSRYPYALEYLDHIAANQTRRQEHAQQSPLFQQSYPYLKDQIAQTNGRLPVTQLTRWGKHASDEALHHAARDLLAQTDQLRLTAYLAIFRRRRFPLGVEPLLPFVRHEHPRIARWSLQAICQFQHPAVRELGLTLIQAKQHVSDALDIFLHNYQSGDEAYLATLVAQTSDVDELHNIGFSISDIFAQHQHVVTSSMFLDLYERGPCSLCRLRFVEQLITADAIPPWLAGEALYDANSETRQAIRIYLQR
jgi:hypothetical protein